MLVAYLPVYQKRQLPCMRERLFVYTVNIVYRTTFFKALPAVNPGVFLAGILIAAPVCGFLPVLDFRERTIKVPNPVTTTLSPFFRESVTAPNTATTDSRAAFAVRLAFLATTSMRSAFVIPFFHLPSPSEALCEGGSRTSANRIIHRSLLRLGFGRQASLFGQRIRTRRNF